MKSKICNACEKELELDHFCNDRSKKKDGKSTICKECRSERVKLFRKNNLKLVREYDRRR